MSIKQRFAASSFWVALGNSADTTIQFVVFVALARLLPVSALGAVAFAMAFIDVLRVVASAGLSEAIIKRKDWDERFASTCFFSNLGIAVFLAITLSILSQLAPKDSSLASIREVIPALSLVLVIEAARAAHVSKLRREFRFKSIAIRSAVSGALAGAIGIALAYQGFGIWSLVVQRLLAASFTTVQTWRATRWTPRFQFDVSALRGLASFTTSVLGSRLLDILTARIPDLLLGALLGPVAVGIYKVGARGLDAITQIVIKPIQFATLPALSQAVHEGVAGRGFLKLTSLFAYFICPALLGSAALAPEIVRIVFGPKFADSGGVMMVLSLSAFPAVLSFFIGPLLIAHGATTALLRLSLLQVTTSAIAVFSLGRYGPVEAAAGVVLAQYLVCPYSLYVISRVAGIGYGAMLKAISLPFAAAAAMGLSIYAFRVNVAYDFAPVLEVGMCVALGVLIYGAFFSLIAWKTQKRLLAEIAGMVLKRRSKPSS